MTDDSPRITAARALISARAVLHERYGLDAASFAELNVLHDRGTWVADERWVVKTYWRSPRREASSDLVRMLGTLVRHDYPAPRLVRAASGAPWVDDRDVRVVVLSYAVGAAPGWTVELVGRMGDLMGRLHALPVDGLPDARFGVRRHLEELRGAFREHAGLSGLDRLEPRLVHLLEEIRYLDDSPSVPIHTDIHPGNLVESPSGRLTVIDWDDAGVGPAILDLGYALAQQTIRWDGSAWVWRPDAFDAFLVSYQRHRPLGRDEREAVVDAMRFGAALYAFAHWLPEIWWAELERLAVVEAERDAIGSRVATA